MKLKTYIATITLEISNVEPTNKKEAEELVEQVLNDIDWGNHDIGIAEVIDTKVKFKGYSEV